MSKKKKKRKKKKEEEHGTRYVREAAATAAEASIPHWDIRA